MSETTYYPVIGLEVHAEMNTNTKMFCACKNDPFNAEPNTHICPICTGQPGAMPYVNKQAVHNVLHVGTALGSEIADFTEFDRKNYFYPDMPKAYQISQYKYPLVSGGSLNGIALTRIHMEEDTATSIHKSDHTLVDFNRSGVPLMELVTEPVVNDAETAMAFARELQLLLRTLGVGEANLEKGEMRIEANISLTTDPERKPENFNPAVEVKNLNSFKIVGAAIAYEIERQTALYESGGMQIKETRGWDEQKQATFSQRTKETADDYRYFPDPDIPKYKLSEISEFSNQALTESLPELPWIKRVRYQELGLKSDQIELLLAFSGSDALFASTIIDQTDPEFVTKAANYITSDLVGMHQDSEINGTITNILPSSMAELIAMIIDGELSSRGAKDTLLIMYVSGGSARSIAEEKGLLQENDTEAMTVMVQQVIDNNPEQVEQYRAGNEKLLQYFVGQVMKESKGSANPGMTAQLLKELL